MMNEPPFGKEIIEELSIKEFKISQFELYNDILNLMDHFKSFQILI